MYLFCSFSHLETDFLIELIAMFRLIRVFIKSKTSHYIPNQCGFLSIKFELHFPITVGFRFLDATTLGKIMDKITEFESKLFEQIGFPQISLHTQSLVGGLTVSQLQTYIVKVLRFQNENFPYIRGDNFAYSSLLTTVY